MSPRNLLIGLAVLAIAGLLAKFVWLDAHTSTSAPDGEHVPALLTSDEDAAEDVVLKARGVGAEPVPSGVLPAPVDFENVDRERDLHGTVVREDGTPVAGASIQVRFYPWRYDGLLTDGQHDEIRTGPATRSARDGTFSVRLQRGDQVHLRVEADGLATTEFTKLSAGERIRIVLKTSITLVVVATTSTGEPASGVFLRTFRAGRTNETFQYDGTTDATGRYAFEGLPPVPMVYLDPRPQHEGWGDPGWVRVELDGDTTHELKLVSGRTLRGRVTNASTGEPIEGARVGMNWVLKPEVKTDEDGRYVLHGWTGNGVQDVGVLADGYGREAAIVGKQETLDFALVPGQRVRGRVLDAAGKPVVGARVSAIGSRRVQGNQEISFGNTITGDDGRFLVGSLVATMDHDLTLFARGYARHFAPVPAQPNQDGLDLGDITLSPGRSLVGVISEADGTPIPRLALELVYIDDGDFGHRYGRSLDRASDDLGRFRYDELLPGKYRLEISPRGSPQTRREVVVADVSEPTRLDVTLDASRELAVLVVDDADKPVRDVYVTARGPGPMDDVSRQTDKGGRVALRIKPGKVRVQVWFAHDEPFEGHKPTTLAPGQSEIKIVLMRAALTKGRVVDPEGKPVPWALVAVERDGDNVASGYADEDGKFTVRMKRASLADLVFLGKAGKSAAQRYLWKQLPLAGRLDGVAAGADVVLRAKSVEGGRALTVRVVDPGGRPLPKIRVMLDPDLEERKRLPTTGDDGQITFHNLLALPTQVRVSLFSTLEQPWRVPPSLRVVPDGQTHEVQLLLGTTIEGTVVDHTGAPRTKGSVQAYIDGESAGAARIVGAGRFVVVVPPDTVSEVELKVFYYENDKGISIVGHAPPGATGVVLRAPKRE